MPRSLPVVLTQLGIVCAVFAAAAAHKPDRPSAPARESSPAAVDVSRPGISAPVHAPAPEPKPAIDDLTDYCIFAAEVDPDWSWPKDGVNAGLDCLEWYDEHRLAEKLETMADVHLDEVPLREFLAVVARRGRINIFVEPQGLQKTGLTLESPVTINVDDIRLRTVLNLLFDHLGLDFELRKGLLVVTALRDKELIARLYRLGDLAYEKNGEGTQFMPDPLIALIRDTIGWVHGGIVSLNTIHYEPRGSIEVIKETQSVVISHTIDAHVIIAARLADLRQVKREYAENGEIDFPHLERIIAWRGGWFPPERLRNDIVSVKTDNPDGPVTIDDQAFGNLDEAMQFLDQRSDKTLLPGILLFGENAWGINDDESVYARLESFCQARDIDLFVNRNTSRRGLLTVQPFRAFKSSRSPYVDEA